MSVNYALAIVASGGAPPLPAMPTALNLVMDGNSNGFGYGGVAPLLLIDYKLRQAGHTTTLNTIAVSGNTIAQRVSAQPTAMAPLFSAGKENICWLMEIINSASTYAALGGTDASNATLVINDLLTWCSNTRSYGFKAKVFLGNNRGNGVQPATNNIVALVNAYVRANWASFCDGIILNDTDARLLNNADPLYRYYNADATTSTVSNVDNFGGLVRVTTSGAHGLFNGSQVTISGVTGAAGTATNGTWTVTVLTSTTFNLQASGVAGAYGGGGSVLFNANVHYNFNGAEIMAWLACVELMGSYALAFHPGMWPGAQYAIYSWAPSGIFAAGGVAITDGTEIRSILGVGGQANGGGTATSGSGTGFIYRATGLGGKPCFENDGTKVIDTPNCSRFASVHVTFGAYTHAGYIGRESTGSGTVGLINPGAPFSTYTTDSGLTLASAYSATSTTYAIGSTPVYLYHHYDADHATEVLELDGSAVTKATEGTYSTNPSIASLTVVHHIGDPTTAPAGKYKFDYFGSIPLTSAERAAGRAWCLAA